MVEFSSLAFDFPQFKELVAAVVGVPTFAYSCYRLGRRKGSVAHRAIIEGLREDLAQTDSHLANLQTKFATLEDTVRDPRDFWIRSPDPVTLAGHQSALQTSMPIICVVNFKGGVGKTTICANLAAHFAQAGKRVLMIDCDYQASLSDTALSQARVERFTANSHHMIESGHETTWLRGGAERLSAINNNLWLYPASYEFSRAEVKMMFRWLVGQDPEIRFNMSSHLQSEAFKNDPSTSFDLVLIDAPPRLLTGSVNALTAATHVLIPTILDGQSHLATLNTLAAIRQFQMKLNPSQKVLGIVPSMVTQATGYTTFEQEYIDELERQIPEFYGSLVPVLKNQPILRRAELAKAGGSEIVVSNQSNAQATRQVREMFAELAAYIEAHVAWRRSDDADGPVMGLPGRLRQRAVS